MSQTFSKLKNSKRKTSKLDKAPFSIQGKLLKEELAEIINQAVRDNRSYLMEHESKEILEGIGIATTGYLIARSEDEAVAMSKKIGFPVVLKIVSPDVVHKTDAGGVKLNLLTVGDVRKAYQEIVETFKYQHIEGVAVQCMAGPGIEVIIGVTRDPSFGHVIMFGLGGVFVEVLKDVSFRILPITKSDAAGMIEEIKGYAILQGYRGKTVDLDALQDVLLKISQLVIANPQISEMDINPLIMYPDGYVAVDARMFISEPVLNECKAKVHSDLHELFYPESIAIIGASDVQGKLGYNVFWNLINHNFPGKLYPINQSKEFVLGVKSYKSILDVEDSIDVAIIIVPAKAVGQSVEDCCRKGVPFAIIVASGFAEIGEEGKNIQAKIEKTIREKGLRILGPNCSGLTNMHYNMVQSIGIIGDMKEGNVGMIAQAGVYAAGILTALRKILDFGIVATIGNKMDINETDILEYLRNDDRIHVIVMYMEDIRNGRRFIEVAGRTTAKKPVILLKAGRTEAGKKAVSSHTASLAGNDEINDAAFRQAGIIRARDNEHLFALSRAFSKQPLPQGKGVLIITYTGSMGVAATDTLYLSGMSLAELEPDLKQQLKNVMPDYATIGNPIDCSFSMTPRQVKDLLEICVEGNYVHSFIVVLQGEMLGSFVEVMKDIDYKGKTIVCSVACKEFMTDNVVKMEKIGIPVYSTAEMAAEVLSQMYSYGVRCRSAAADVTGRHPTKDTLPGEKTSLRLRAINSQDNGSEAGGVDVCSPKSL